MEWWTLGIIIFLALVLLIFIGVPIAFSLGIMSAFYALLFWPQGLNIFAFTSYGKMYSFMLVAVPLFIFMAEMIVVSGSSSEAYDAVHKWMGPLPGGLAVSSLVATGVFAACCGAAAGAIASIGRVSIPEMLKRGYDRRLAVGSVAAGATVAELIPPSIFMILIGVITETSIGKLFIGGVIPGILQISLFIIYIVIRSKLNPSYGPAAVSVRWKERWSSLYKVIPLLFLAILVFGTLYSGMVTPTEVAAIGAFGSILIAAICSKITWEKFQIAILNTVRITCFVLWILFAAAIFSQMITRIGIPQGLCEWIISLSVNKYVILLIINIVLLMLGCFIDPAGIIMITIPIFVPIMESLGFSLVWFGVIFVINMEIALLTPPLGLNLYVVKAVLFAEAGSDIPITEIVRAVTPFLLLGILLIVILTVFPELVTWLPETMIK